MINKAVLENGVKDKLLNRAFHAIINETFINAIPVEMDELSRSNKVGLSKYSFKVLESMGGIDVLHVAMEHETDPIKCAFLNKMYNICNEAATKACKRICKENADTIKEDATKLSDIVDKAAFTEKEFEEFAKDAKSITNEKLQSIIQKKTIDVIKSEKEAYEKEEALKNELEEAISDSDDFASTSVESYMDIVLKKTDAKRHTSVFSKLQELTLESVIFTNEPSEIPFNSLYRVTLENTFNMFPQYKKTSLDTFSDFLAMKSMESFNTLTPEDKKKIMDKALLGTAIIYTMFETLKTMNLFSPALDEVCGFIEKDKRIFDNVNGDRTKISDCVKDIVCAAKAKCDGKATVSDISAIQEGLKKAKERIMENTFFTEDEKNKIISIIESGIDYGNDRILAINTKEKPSAESMFDKNNKQTDIAQLNKIHRLYCKKSNNQVSEVRFNINDKSDKLIDVTAHDITGKIVSESFVDLRYDFKDNKAYLREIAKESDLSKTNKSVCLYMRNYGKKESL